MRRGLAIAGSFVLLLAAVTTLVSAQQGPAEGDPLELFAVMMPVFSHARCANCHGGVDPHAESGPLEDTHDGGIIPVGGTCADSGCHTQSNDADPKTKWQTAAPHHSFGGKSAKELCDMQSPIARRMRPPEDYFHHLETDFLIDLAFVGESGGASPTAPAPPPMKKKEFLSAARAWLDAGAGCGEWKGKIIQTETFASNYGFPIAGATASIRESAKRVVTLTRANGQTTADIVMSGHGMQQLVKQDGTCTTTVTNEKDWNNAASAGPKPATIRFAIAADGTYHIRFRGPPEKTRMSGTDTGVSNCGALPLSLPTDADLEWDPWVYTIRCPPKRAIDRQLGESVDCNLFDPKNWPRLKGELTRVVFDRKYAFENQSWLIVSPADVSRGDTAERLPVTVVTEWDFELVEP